MTIEEAMTALRESDQGVTMKVKVIPQAQRTRVVGLLGDRIKLFVTATPESGKANEMVCHCLALALGLPKGAVTVLQGHTQPLKTLLLRGIAADDAAQRLVICTPSD